MTTAAHTPVGIAHLTLLDLSPPELVSTAAAAGYDFVGIRVQAATAGEYQYPMQPGSAMSTETLRRLDDTGLTVRDIEFLALGANTARDDWMPALEAGAALGASTISVAGTDSDHARLTETLSRLVADARQFEILPTLEPISYQAVNRIADAARIAQQAGSAVLVDAVHMRRGGDSPDDVRALDPALVPCLQLCDGSSQAPRHLEVPEALPLGMTTNGSPLQLESRGLRQPLGEGELPLRGLLDAVAAGTPVSVEAPNAYLRASLSAHEYALRNRQAVRRLLEQDSQWMVSNV